MLITRIAARDARHRAGVVAIHRHVLAGRACCRHSAGCTPTPGSLATLRAGGVHLGERAVLRQPLAQAGAGERRGAVSIFDDRLGGDVRLSSCSATCRRLPRSSAPPSSSAPGSTFTCASAISGAAETRSIRRRSRWLADARAVAARSRRTSRSAPTSRRSRCSSSSATTTRRATGGSNRPAWTSPAPGSDAAGRRSTGSRTSPARCARPDW